MQKYLFPVLALFLSTHAFAAMNGQIINCDEPNPLQPQYCVDNWALDLLDENKTAIETAPAALPRDHKHYFDGTGAGVHIFMMDTGIDGNNPDFKVLGNPSQNRFGESYYGDFITEGDGQGSHGTRTAALAAGLQYGVAKGATIHAIRSADVISGQNGGNGILERLNWIYDKVTINGLRPAVLNMSFNIPRPVTTSNNAKVEAQLTQRVRDLINAGVVVTVSAGNKNSNNPGAYWPSSIPEVILVGGVDENGNRWVRDTSDPDYNNICVGPPPPAGPYNDCGSNYGSLIDIWAPAKYIRSAVLTSNRDNLAPRVRSGTSYAAPLVAGLAALYLEQNPSATPAQVRSALLANAANLGDIDGNGTADYLARSPVAAPACNVTQRIFVNTGVSVPFTSSQLQDSCPAGYEAFAQFNASHGTGGIGGIGPNDIRYFYTSNLNYTGMDQFNYLIYTDTGGTYGTGTVSVTVQPTYN
jgi:subtilisin family serine protease